MRNFIGSALFSFLSMFDKVGMEAQVKKRNLKIVA